MSEIEEYRTLYTKMRAELMFKFLRFRAIENTNKLIEEFIRDYVTENEHRLSDAQKQRPEIVKSKTKFNRKSNKPKTLQRSVWVDMSVIE